jgi:hypothetical protein
MSTRTPLSWNSPDFPRDNPNIDKVPEINRDPGCPEYCLYEDLFQEDGDVYLEMRGCEFHATHTGATVRIPREVWNRIIKIGERHEPEV